MRARFTALVVVLGFASSLAPPILYAQPSNDLSTASLEQLTQMQVSVSSFARRDEDLWKTPAAVFVITKEDIARSAVSSIPDLLRMVPGLQVAQIDASAWAVSARGFNSAYADKLLVLIDGRTVYSEVYAGSHWDEIDLPLDDIERIEVIRGPGAAVWGTNAVNGVMNIITKKARNTMGTSAANNISGIGETADLRYGGPLGQRTQFRAFARYINRQPFDVASGTPSFDGGNTIRGGGRLDWQRSASDWITTSGDLYGGHLKQQIVAEIALPVGPNGNENESIAGGHLLSRWEHKFERSDTALQVYFDEQSRHELAAYIRTRTIDFDYQDHLAAGSHHDLVYGSEFRFTADHLQAAIPETTKPDYRNYLVNGFVQDEIAIIQDHLIVTLGSKIQNGTLAGFQVQPSARILWAPTKAQSLWGGVSRAAAAPSLQDKGLEMPISFGIQQGFPATGILHGNPDFRPETVIAYEFGYRRMIGKTLNFDLATFFNINRRLETLSIVNVSFAPAPSPHFFTDVLYTNSYRAKTAGVEASALWKPLATLSLQGSLAWMQARTVQTDAGPALLLDSWNAPRNTYSGSASWSFAPQWTANSFLSYVSHLGPFVGLLDSNSNIVPAYTRLDLHLTRKLGRGLKVDAGGTNLLAPRHVEFGTGKGFVWPTQIPRSGFVRATWSF